MSDGRQRRTRDRPTCGRSHRARQRRQGRGERHHHGRHGRPRAGCGALRGNREAKSVSDAFFRRMSAPCHQARLGRKGKPLLPGPCGTLSQYDRKKNEDRPNGTHCQRPRRRTLRAPRRGERGERARRAAAVTWPGGQPPSWQGQRRQGRQPWAPGQRPWGQPSGSGSLRCPSRPLRANEGRRSEMRRQEVSCEEGRPGARGQEETSQQAPGISLG